MRRRGWGGGAAIAALLCTTGGCGDDAAPRAWRGEIRDSAGVEIVENDGVPLWSAAEAWSAGEELAIGGDESRPETLFGYVADLAVGDDGRVYVLDQQAQAIRVFDAHGASVATIGGSGEGPGELGRFAFSLMVRADTLLVVDWGQARLSRFSTGGAFMASEPLPTQGSARSWWRSGASGLHLRSLARYTDDQGLWQGRDALLRYGGEGIADTLLVFDYAPTDLGAPDAPMFPLLVNAPSWTILENGGVAWLAPAEGRVRVHDTEGRLRRIIASSAWLGRPPTADEVAILAEKAGNKLEALGGSRQVLERLPVEPPARLPAVTSVAAGPHGTVWVQRLGDVADVHPMALNTPDPPTGWGGGTWDVLDARGRFLGSVELPPRLRVLRIVGDAVYGVRTDALDVEHVVRVRVAIPAFAGPDSTARHMPRP